ncbi:MAG: hypothetical protein INQ03_02315 [Candidatus Heimdallarchaeota archaeon]|nr:hypothetical protein [Candidatus Heimdallarchaeota archaeon]
MAMIDDELWTTTLRGITKLDWGTTNPVDFELLTVVLLLGAFVTVYRKR